MYMYGYGDGQRAAVVFDVDVEREQDHDGLDTCRRLLVSADPEHVYGNGLPEGRELERLAGVERAFVHLLEEARVDCRKVAHQHYAGLRDVIFQVGDVGAFDRVAAGFAPPGALVEFRGSEGWTFYDTRVRPTPERWEWVDNRRVVDLLLEAGADRTGRYVLEHSFVGHPFALDAVAAFLTGVGAGVLRGPAEEHLVLLRESSLDVDEITSWTLRLRALAADKDATYDGWGSATR